MTVNFAAHSYDKDLGCHEDHADRGAQIWQLGAYHVESTVERHTGRNEEAAGVAPEYAPELHPSAETGSPVDDCDREQARPRTTPRMRVQEAVVQSNQRKSM